MKLLICYISMFCLSYINAQKPPLKATVNCTAVVGIYEKDLTDKDGVSLEYSENTCEVFYKGKLYTGKVKSCKNNKIFGITNYVNGKIEGECYGYYENGNLAIYIVYGKNNSETEMGYDEANHRTIMTCDGVSNGEEIQYNENGKLWFNGFNSNGKREGKWYFYDEKGAVMEVRTYKDGEEISCSGKCD
ncbi:MAG: hypothetical protein RL308_2385 [Bacteroidota bacterium]